MRILVLTFTLLFFVHVEFVDANELLKKLENKNKTQKQDENIPKEIILDCKVESFTDINKRLFLRRDLISPEVKIDIFI